MNFNLLRTKSELLKYDVKHRMYTNPVIVYLLAAPVRSEVNLICVSGNAERVQEKRRVSIIAIVNSEVVSSTRAVNDIAHFSREILCLLLRNIDIVVFRTVEHYRTTTNIAKNMYRLFVD